MLLADSPECGVRISLNDQVVATRQHYSSASNSNHVPKKIGVAKHRESRTLGEAVGAEMTRLGIARGWSQQKLADELGYTERYIGQLERGTKSPTLRTIADSQKHSRRCPLLFSEPLSDDTGTAESAERNPASPIGKAFAFGPE